VTKGDFVIIASSSTTALAAIQITNYAGATPIALTRTSTKKEQLLEAGAAHVIATEEQDVVAEVMRITNGNGARVVFDPVVGPTFSKLILALANQGIVYIYGNLSESDTQMPVLEFYPKMASIKGYGLYSITRHDARHSWGRAPEVPSLTTAGAGHQQSANNSQAHTKPPGPVRTWGNRLLALAPALSRLDTTKPQGTDESWCEL